MYINIESVKVVEANYHENPYILVNNKYYVFLNGDNLSNLEQSDLVNCAPKESKKGYLYLNPIQFYKSI